MDNYLHYFDFTFLYTIPQLFHLDQNHFLKPRIFQVIFPFKIS